jgi:hypothetical protein
MRQSLSYGTTFRPALCTMVKAPSIGIWIQECLNGWLIEYGTILIPDDRPCFSTNIFQAD